jgi:hypothetical protein
MRRPREESNVSTPEVRHETVTRPKRPLRYELKYLVRREQADAVMAELTERMTLDTHGNADGVYPITSLYYDTPGYRAYWAKIDGERNRRKVRVRVYDNQIITPETSAFLEVKQRVDKLMRKRRVILPYAAAVDFDAFDALAQANQGDGAALLQEVYYLYRTLQLRPSCIVTYDRKAYEGDAYHPDLRVTVDTNLRGRVHDLSLLSTGIAENRAVLGAEFAVLEVKANSNVPTWIAQVLARHHCSFYRISKYCLVLEKCRAIAGRQQFTTVAGG